MAEDENSMLARNISIKYDFNLELEQAKKVVRDMYGVNTRKSKIMFEKLEKCKNVTQITMTLAWGRRNLL